MVINVIFWACFEQAGTSLTLFADRNVDRMIMGWEMPASMTQFFNPFFIVLFGSIFTWMWVRLDADRQEPFHSHEVFSGHSTAGPGLSW